jgi:hypothetical protein
MWVITVAIIWPISSSLSHFYERMCEVASTGTSKRVIIYSVAKGYGASGLTGTRVRARSNQHVLLFPAVSVLTHPLGLLG